MKSRFMTLLTLSSCDISLASSNFSYLRHNGLIVDKIMKKRNYANLTFNNELNLGFLTLFVSGKNSIT